MNRTWHKINPTQWEIEEGRWRIVVERRDPAKGTSWAIYFESEMVVHGDKAVQYVSSAKRAAKKVLIKLLRKEVK